MELGRKMGCDTAFVLATGIGSQKSFEKVGFQVINEIPYEDVRDVNGEQLIYPQNGTPSSKFYALKL